MSGRTTTNKIKKSSISSWRLELVGEYDKDFIFNTELRYLNIDIFISFFNIQYLSAADMNYKYYKHHY